MQRLAIAVIAYLASGISAPAAELEVMFGVSRPPYIMEDQRTGIVFEIAAAIFERMGISFNPSFGSNKRLDRELLTGRIDVAVEVQPTDAHIYYSDPLVAYRNFAVARKRDRIGMTNFADLRGRSVCAWQGASTLVGEPLQKAIPGFASYREYPLQKEQVRVWLAGLCDVILIDDTLLNWHTQNLSEAFRSQGREIDMDVNYYAFPGNNQFWFYAGFRDKSLRDRFNRVLAEIRQDGTYDRIREGFLARH